MKVVASRMWRFVVLRGQCRGDEEDSWLMHGNFKLFSLVWHKMFCPLLPTAFSGGVGAWFRPQVGFVVTEASAESTPTCVYGVLYAEDYVWYSPLLNSASVLNCRMCSVWKQKWVSHLLHCSQGGTLGNECEDKPQKLFWRGQKKGRMRTLVS